MQHHKRRATLLFALVLAVLAWCLWCASVAQDNLRCRDGRCPVAPDTLCEMAVDYAGAPAGYSESVVLDLPPELRQTNWGGGSCVHASNVTLLRWMGQDDLPGSWS